MSLRTPLVGVLGRAALALAGSASAVALAQWQLATACFALLAASEIVRARRAEARVADHRLLHVDLTAAAAADPARFAELMIDADVLKAITDRHGPLEGDELLQAVGRALADAVHGTAATLGPRCAPSSSPISTSADAGEPTSSSTAIAHH